MGSLKISSMKGVMRFSFKSKLSSRYARPYPIIKVKGLVSYRVQLPINMFSVNNLFHNSIKRKGVVYPHTYDNTFVVRLKVIVGRHSKTTQSTIIEMVKVHGVKSERNYVGYRIQDTTILSKVIFRF